MNGNPGPVLCFGELLLRLSAPRGEALLQGSRLDAHFGGAEGNVAVALARLGRPSAMVSTVSDDTIGDAALESLRKAGVDVSRVRRVGGRLGIYFLTPPAGPSAASVVYDRWGSAFASTPDYDWPEVLEGAAWLHLSGIVPALGAEIAQSGLAAVAAAHEAGVRVSFDGNFRGSLWSRWCADPGPILEKYVAGADLLFGNHRDLSLVLGKPLSGEGDAERRKSALEAFAHFPRLAAIAATEREIVASDHHRLSARIDTREDSFTTSPLEVTGIVDRIGTGDAFAAGVLARIDDGLAEAAMTGLAVAAHKHGIAGDHSMASPRDIAAFEAGHSDVRR